MGKRLGQHFLTSTAIAKQIVESANIQPSDVVLEVGPGKGILTQFLVEKAKQVIAVEKDKQLVRYLREKFKDTRNIEIIYGDILKPKAYRLKPSHKIVANLPYYITSRFLRLFLEEMPNKPQAMVLMIQKEVAERICAKPPHMNLLALSVQAFGVPKILFRVSRGNFAPPPEVDSAVIAVENISDAFFKKRAISPKEFFALPKKAFSQKRKMLRSSLGNIPKLSEVRLPIISRRKSDFRKFHLRHFLTKRPQELTLEDWASIFMSGLK